MIRFLSILLVSIAPLAASDFRHIGDFLITSHFKLTGDKVTPIPLKPMALHVFTNGVKIRISAEDDLESHTTFEIYRSDGISRQRTAAGPLEIVPGLQATCNSGGALRHLRLSGESLTITTFPGVSDQTTVTHAVAATRNTAATPAQPQAEKP